MNAQLSLTDVSYLPWQAVALAASNPLVATDTPYRPKQWDNELFFINNNVAVVDGDGNTLIEADTSFFFDAVIKANHLTQRRLTQHPVQTGANITDHSYQLPARVTFEIGISDSMDSYQPFSQTINWSGSSIKSVGAYETLRKLQDYGIPFQVTTRIFTYQNMVIESITVNEDFTTLNSLRALITFQQIIVATASTTLTAVSSDSQTTAVTNKGEVTPKDMVELVRSPQSLQSLPTSSSGSLFNTIFGSDLIPLGAP